MRACVNLYDSAANVLRTILTSPNCKAPTSSQFVGRGGRYLAVASMWEVILWDLPAQSGVYDLDLLVTGWFNFDQ